MTNNEQDILEEIHTPNELSDIFGDKITGAELLQKNFDSVVLLLTTQNTGKWVYKFYKRISIEPLFYKQAKSDLLAKCRVILNEERKTALLLRYIEGRRLDSLKSQPDNLMEYARDIISKIATIKNPPFAERFDTYERWREYLQQNFEYIDKVSIKGLFKQINPDYINILKDSVTKIDWQVVFESPCGLINCDLHNENIFLMPDNTWKIIDWEMPCIGPSSVDMAGLLENLTLDPYQYLPREAVKMMNLVKLFLLVNDFDNKHEKIRLQDERLIFLRLSGVMG
jgi:thiamine kinase-like enzyme